LVYQSADLFDLRLSKETVEEIIGRAQDHDPIFEHQKIMNFIRDKDQLAMDVMGTEQLDRGGWSSRRQR